MFWGKKVAGGALAAVLMATGTSLVTPAPAEAAAAKYACKAEVHLDLGRPKATSSCKKSGSGKKVSKHRVKLVCDVVRGRGTPHSVPWTLYGPWKKPGQKSTVKCGFSSFTRSWSVQTKA
ncbi:hypothetical protein G3I38_34220 [Streptomyces sp. SID7958]|uniref:Subtilisin inhibitor domain-containing protein n=2 Tax=unclassified Streptomyces TaxID=2593676 RepID=A0A6G3QXG6_9ACTN|nr:MULTISPECIES: hypothetical protein [unclassified Streptomyces]NEA88193.1 hypothetical protein [Streptomyces sp. SID14436]NEC84155.1 hypothetical protein [Streptomyces sp. SID7958]